MFSQKVKRERVTPSTAWLVGHGRTRKQIHQPCPSPFTRNRLAIELFLIFCQLLPTARTHHRIVSWVFVGKELCALVGIESLQGCPPFLITSVRFDLPGVACMRADLQQNQASGSAADSEPSLEHNSVPLDSGGLLLHQVSRDSTVFWMVG